MWFCGMGKKDEALLLAMAAAPSDVDGGGKCDPAAAATAATAAKKDVDVTYANSTATTHAVIRTEDSADTVTQE